MYIALYILYAFAQAILIARYGMAGDDEPVMLVVLLAIFAPIASAITASIGIGKGIKWLVTYRSPNK